MISHIHTGILLPIPIIEYQTIKLFTFIVNYYQIPATITNYLHNNINQLLKELSGGHLKKEDIFYGLLMNEYHPNDTIYKDLRNVLVEIYNIPPKDTITLMWVKKLDEMYKNNK